MSGLTNLRVSSNFARLTLGRLAGTWCFLFHSLSRSISDTGARPLEEAGKVILFVGFWSLLFFLMPAYHRMSYWSGLSHLSLILMGTLYLPLSTHLL